MADTIDVRASCGHTVWMPKGMMRAPIDNMERRGMCDDCRGNRDDLVAKRAQSETKKAQSRPLGGMKEPKAPNPMDQLGVVYFGVCGMRPFDGVSSDSHIWHISSDLSSPGISRCDVWPTAADRIQFSS